MTENQIREEYALKMDKAETSMERNLMKAEMNHKLKLINAGEETNYQNRASESKFECVGCGS